jgi:cytoskeletal protein RodZ
MKELGQYLKETRTNNGVSIDEAAQDLNIDSFLLESIEDGNTRAFKDVLSMKDKIKEYAKYLGLKPEEVIDEFNDYLFEKTSKISLQDILDAEKGTDKNKQNETKKISSPYTIVKPKKKDKKPILYFIGIIMFLILLVLIIFIIIKPRKDKIVKELKVNNEGDYYEFAK